MRLLFMKDTLAWPRSSGHDVHTFYMMQACVSLGHDVSFATVTDPPAGALNDLKLTSRVSLRDGPVRPPDGRPPATRLQERFRQYWGIPESRISTFHHAARDLKADAVIVVGLDVLPYLPGLPDVVRVWYAADEWILHHMSQIRIGGPRTGADLRDAAIKGLYERAHRGAVDRVWVVSTADRLAARWLAGLGTVDVLPNGVDSAFFAPGLEVPEPHTAVFWGRLDFGPNIDALEWFCRRVWPLIRRAEPNGRFTIIGFSPGAAVKALSTIDGVCLESDLPDLRSAVRRRSVAVLPFVSGAGIKNKLLEAAAMGVPIVCTSRTARALQGKPPLLQADTADAFAKSVLSLWQDSDQRTRLARDGRSWVVSHHTWDSVARIATAGLQTSLTQRASSRIA